MTSAAETGSRRALERYLDVLFGRARRSTLIEVRWRLEMGMGQRFAPVAARDSVAALIVDLAAAHDVYVGVLPRWRPAGGRAAIVGDCRTVWLDLDTDVAERVLAPVDPAPTLRVASGGPGHLHAYWSLRVAVPPRDIERANRRLAWALGGDLSSADAPRILRPPQTFHHGRSGAPVTLVDTGTTVPCRLADLVGGLADPPIRCARPYPRAAARRTSTDPLLSLAPERYVLALTGQRVGRTRKVHCPLHELSVGEAKAGGVLPARSFADASSNDPVSPDPLLLVPPPVYFERLTGLRVGRSGKLRCLFHDDQRPSLHVYREAGRGWYCFGCGRGGSVYDLAALLSGRNTRGADFLELRCALEKLLL